MDGADARKLHKAKLKNASQSSDNDAEDVSAFGRLHNTKVAYHKYFFPWHPYMNTTEGLDNVQKSTLTNGKANEALMTSSSESLRHTR
jgi:hypothetical protein